MLDPEIISALRISISLTLTVSAILTVVSPLIAIAMTGLPRWWRMIIEPIIFLPMVMPPTVLGFYFLIMTGNDSWLQQIFPGKLAFSFPAIVAACCIASGPLAIGSLVTAFDEISDQHVDAAKCLGLGPVDRFFRVWLPLSRRSFVAGIVMSAAHTMGAFGLVMMVGGSIAGQTKTLSIVVYDRVEVLDFTAAHQGAACLIAAAFVMLVVVQSLSRRHARVHQ